MADVDEDPGALLNKNHLIILTTGLGGSLALTMMMGHLLSLKPDIRAGGAITRRFEARFAASCTKTPSLVIRKLEGETQPPRITVVARIAPKPTVDIDRLILQIGGFLWNSRFEEGGLAGVVVRWRDPSTGALERMALQRPGSRPTLKLFGRRQRASRSTR